MLLATFCLFLALGVVHGGFVTTGALVSPQTRALISGPRALVSLCGHVTNKAATVEGHASEGHAGGGYQGGMDTRHVSLYDAFRVATSDRRRVDELVTRFDYNAQVHAAGETYSGHGAIKRFFAEVLLRAGVQQGVSEQGYCRLELLESRPGDAPGLLRMVLATRSAGSTHLLLAPTFGVGAMVSELTVEEEVQRGDPLLGETSLQAEGEEGPKWETFDGRVRQQIWQHAGLFDAGNSFLKDTMGLTTGRVIMVVDEVVWGLYGPKFERWAESMSLKLDVAVTPGNEDRKTLETFTFLLDELKRLDPLRRSEPVLAVGGGVLTDTVGFACACWRRGIPWCRLPTTLLGMVDASVGIKVAINYHRKNGVGHFFSPLHSFIDPDFLPTVSAADIRSGCGEIMKAAIIHDARLYTIMKDHGERLIEQKFTGSAEADEIVKLSVDAMLECIGPDLWEEALLRPMDFGHSFSRTLETDERFKLRHGEAVAIDCIMSSLIAEQKGLLPASQADELLELYARLGLPCSIAGITADTYKRARDEIIVHRDGLLRAPMPAGLGTCVYVDEISDDEIQRAFSRLSDFIRVRPDVEWNPSKSFAAAAE